MSELTLHHRNDGLVKFFMDEIVVDEIYGDSSENIFSQNMFDLKLDFHDEERSQFEDSDGLVWLDDSNEGVSWDSPSYMECSNPPSEDELEAFVKLGVHPDY